MNKCVEMKMNTCVKSKERAHVLMLDICSSSIKRKCKKDLKKYNSYWVDAASVLLLVDGISADEGLVVG